LVRITMAAILAGHKVEEEYMWSCTLDKNTKEFQWSPEDASNARDDDDKKNSTLNPTHRLLIKNAFLLPNAKKDEVTILQIEYAGYNKKKVVAPIVAMKGGVDLQRYIDLLVPCPAKITLLSGDGPIQLVGTHCLDHDHGPGSNAESEDSEERSDTSSETDDEPEERVVPTPEVEEAWNAAVDNLLAGSPACHIILFEHPFKPGQTPDTFTTEYVLGIKHILLPVQVGRVAVKLEFSISTLVYDWEGGGTSCGNAVWYNFMMPQLEEAQQMIQRKKWRMAFGILMGLQMFCSGDGYWIHDQEVYCDFEDFSGWFSDYSKAWLDVLGKSDSQLGLAVARGKEGGYRGVLRNMLEKWEKETNEELREFDRFAGDEGKARVRMFSDAGSSAGSSEEEEGEEEDE